MKKTCAPLAGALAALILLGGCAAPGIRDDGWKDVPVSSAEELFQAIAPDARITIKPGSYDLSGYIEAVREGDVEAWNAGHPYVRIEDCFDGAMAVITGVNGLVITGGSDRAQDTELAVRPLYADVLTFEDCVGVEVKNLTAGHIEAGDCSGSVVRLENCRGVRLENVDLYGCGIMAVEAEYCRGLSVKNSVLRDCSWAAGSLCACRGDVLFEDCVMTGSGGGFFLWDNDQASVVFRRCTFGQEESNGLYFVEDAVFEDCRWEEITEYPDYEFDSDDFRSALEIVPFDAEFLRNTGWTGIWVSESEYDGLPEGDVSLIVNEEDAVLEGLAEQPMKLAWQMDPDSDYAADFFDADGQPAALCWVYRLGDDGDDRYLELGVGDRTVWFVMNQG